MKVSSRNAECLKDILTKYCDSSGQKISEGKSSIFFSGNTDVEEKMVVCNILNIMIESIFNKYLGLPVLVGVDRTDCFRHLVDRVRARISGWKEKLLSTGGKEILIKYVAQAILVFMMMVYILPNKICKGMTDAMSQYWWGDGEEQKRIHWQQWWKLYMPCQKIKEVWVFMICKVS
ncbi:hypothetical protein PR202_gb25813 [Eleusine coracana subsp. coracana]|uniref:Reverse transcriptase n=1 Tax=Eleusine coracana subsp. coracana TaxID=191504 RepID=A0AAV5FR00_ELECO|nr:hypothetical protein PR202_gb25777 [Eleusine coracana subsp. coracana]GJN36910.1 hypothetical protein PR202_gb25813 [Eleusine coracana subsp. coracana]